MLWIWYTKYGVWQKKIKIKIKPFNWKKKEIWGTKTLYTDIDYVRAILAINYSKQHKRNNGIFQLETTSIIHTQDHTQKLIDDSGFYIEYVSQDNSR